MSFESKLSEGKFCIPECQKCNKITWPPSEFCSNCFATTSLKEGDFKGKIIEFSKQEDRYFCVVEFADVIRIMATILEHPKIGQSVTILKCGVKNNDYFFQVS